MARRRVTSGEVAAALAKAGRAPMRGSMCRSARATISTSSSSPGCSRRPPSAAICSACRISRTTSARMPTGAQAIFVASNGPYDFLGTKYFRHPRATASTACGSFRTGGRSASCRATISCSIAPPRAFRASRTPALFALAGRRRASTRSSRGGSNSGQRRRALRPPTVAFRLDYKVPDALVLMPQCRSPEPPPVAAWVEAWSDARVNVAILAVLLSVLTADLRLPGAAGASSPRPSAGAQRLPAGRAGLARLDRRRAALDRQCHQLRHGAVQALRHRLLSRRAADGDHRRLHADLAGADRARRVLRLAVPVRRAAGTARPGLARARRAAMESVGRAGAAPVDGQVHRGRRRAGAGDDRRSIRRAPPLEIEPFKTAITSKFTRAWPYRRSMPARCWRSACSPSAPIAASCARSAACSRRSTGCTSSICSSAVPNAAVPAICASAPARCGRSSRPARSTPRNASSAWIARSNIMTTSAARRWCRPPSCAMRQREARWKPAAAMVNHA